MENFYDTFIILSKYLNVFYTVLWVFAITFVFMITAIVDRKNGAKESFVLGVYVLTLLIILEYTILNDSFMLLIACFSFAYSFLFALFEKKYKQKKIGISTILIIMYLAFAFYGMKIGIETI